MNLQNSFEGLLYSSPHFRNQEKAPFENCLVLIGVRVVVKAKPCIISLHSCSIILETPERLKIIKSAVTSVKFFFSPERSEKMVLKQFLFVVSVFRMEISLLFFFFHYGRNICLFVKSRKNIQKIKRKITQSSKDDIHQHFDAQSTAEKHLFSYKWNHVKYSILLPALAFTKHVMNICVRVGQVVLV